MDLYSHKAFHQLVNNGIDIGRRDAVVAACLFYLFKMGAVFHILRPLEKPHPPADLIKNPVLRREFEKPVDNSDQFLLILRQFPVNGFKQISKN